MVNKRECTLDILKGICMLSIVSAHFIHSEFLWFQYLQVYGFYFVAGYTFKDKPLKAFVKSKVYRLYFSFVLSCLFTCFVLKLLSIMTNGRYFFVFNLNILKEIFLFNLPNNILAPAWFVFPLFIVLVVYYILNKIIKNEYFILSILFIMYCFSYYYRDYLNLYVWNDCMWITNVGIGLFTFGFGKMINTNNRLKTFLFNSKYTKDIFIFLTFVLWVIYNYSDFECGLRIGYFNSFICNTIICTLGMLFIFYLSKLISGSKIFALIFSLIGRNSMAIMYFHILSTSMVTLFAHFYLGYPYPDNWSMSYNGGVIGLLNIMVGIFVPVTISMMIEKSKCLMGS